MRIFNTSGRLVHTGQVPAGQVIRTIELNTLPDGLYILELRSEGNSSLYYRTKFFHY